MVKLGKLTDYGLVLMTCIARDAGRVPAHGARSGRRVQAAAFHRQQAAEGASAERPAGFPSRHKGRLHAGARAARDFRDRNHRGDRRARWRSPSAARTITGLCNLEPCCPIKSNQQIINQAVRGVLEKITLSDLIQPMQLTTIKDARGKLVPPIASGRIQ